MREAVLRFALKCLILTMGLSGAASAQDAPAGFPRAPIRIIVPSSAGATLDILARFLADALAARLPQPVIVDDRPGAGGSIGAMRVAQAPADGYTLLVGDISSYIVAPLILSDVHYGLKDFEPVSYVGRTYLYFVANAGLNVNNLAEFIALAKSKPGEINYASPGIGSPAHIAFEALQQRTGIKLVHVPYNGASPGITALLAGEVGVAMFGSTAMRDGVREGKVRALATPASGRSPFDPDVPSAAEFGLDNFNFVADITVLAPAGTPKPIVDYLSREIAAGLNEPKTSALYKNVGFEIVGGSPAALDKLNKDAFAAYQTVITQAGIKAN